MAVVSGRKGGQAALKAPPEMFLTALGAVGLPRLSCPRQEGNHTPALWGFSSSPGGPFRGRWWEALALLTFCPRLTFPLSFLPAFAPLHCHLDPCVLSRHLLCPSQPSAFPWQMHKEGRGELLGAAGGLSRQQHKVPFVTACAFDQPVKGSSRV